jgi:hypothetical protein
MNHISITDQIAKLDDRRYRDGIDDKEYWTQVNAIYTDSGSPYAWLIKRLLEVQPGYLVLPEQPGNWPNNSFATATTRAHGCLVRGAQRQTNFFRLYRG